MDKLFNHIDNLTYRINPDGSVDLEQDLGAGNVERVFLHRVHVRLILEETHHLLPPPPADELSKRLARQLCLALRELCSETGVSPVVDRVITSLTAWKEGLPDAIFPFDIYQDKEDEAAGNSSINGSPAFELQPPEANPKSRGLL
jgi:hypothetical protein